MIWVSHDLYKNFLKSFNTGDINLSLDIFRSEVSDLLTQKPDDFISLLDKIKIKHKKKESYEELLDIVLTEMKVNEKFVRGLAFIIGQNNDVIKKNPKMSWVKLIDAIKRGIEQIATYFEENPKQEKLFRKKALEMVQLKSSVIGDDTRPLNKKDNTVLWILGLTAVGVVGYLIYRHFNNIEEAKLRAESLNPNSPSIPSVPSIPSTPIMESGGNLAVNQPAINQPTTQPLNNKSLDPAYNVSESVLLPEAKIQQIPNANVPNNININVQPMPVQQ